MNGLIQYVVFSFLATFTQQNYFEIHPYYCILYYCWVTVHQPWDFFGGNDAEAETPALWPPHAKSWLIGKDSDARRDWGQEEEGMTEDEMAGWHHRLDGREFQWTPGAGEGQGCLACCSSWGCKESDTTEQLNWLADLNILWHWMKLTFSSHVATAEFSKFAGILSKASTL